ncbi:MerR family transcriptional regulator [uncultured Ruegeria sp.]|uniref:MerR family transcriptional regulator n=1 Tax=uncultured Ruegeria sp. TaxID=259304 RepID=UPI0026151D5D|nr:MerR family transcriptional regulator [uncultured Ruegeria sp.]
MKYRVETREHEFNPGEVAKVTGVSTSLQRDWRRRKVTSGKTSQGWNKYSLSEVIRMSVMRAFTQSGISLETADLVSSLAVLPVMDELVHWEDVAVFKGDTLSSEQMDKARDRFVSGASGDDQFTFVALPEQKGTASASRIKNLADGESILGRSDNFYGIVLDHSLLAHRIAGLSTLPLIEFIVTVTEDRNG